MREKPGYFNPIYNDVQHVRQFFRYEHLPDDLRRMSRRFHALAEEVASSSCNRETVEALRKLVEAKDAAVRAIWVENKRDP